MARVKTYYYLIDRLTEESARRIRSALEAIDDIEIVRTTVASGILEVQAKRDVETEVQMAIDIAGCIFRTRVKKRLAR